MTKKDNCNKSSDKSEKCSSSSESEVSEVCYKVKCEPKCGKKECDIPVCPCLRPEEIACLFKSAVVEVHAEFILVGTSGATAVTGGTPLGDNARADIILQSNGFFIKGHYIIVPASTVLLPPSLTSSVSRYPYFTGAFSVNGNIQSEMVCASRILVSVFNVNNKDKSYVYEAEMVGVDGAGNIAVIRINSKKEWNRCNPCIEKCHPYLKFGSSRSAKEGEKVYLLGDYITDVVNRREFNAAGAICEGVLSDHRYVDYSGWNLAESVLVSAPAYAFSSGLPVLDCRGKVLGMQTTDLAAVLVPFVHQSEGYGFVSGPSEFFMRRVVRTIIKGICGCKYPGQLRQIRDPIGAYYRYTKAYVGVAYDLFTGVDYDTTSDFTSGGSTNNAPRVRLSTTGQFLASPACKDLDGVRVIGLAGLNPSDASSVANGYYFVPGGVTGAAPFADLVISASPLVGVLQPGDVITSINGLHLGDLNKQIAPALITWRLCCDDELEICYRKGGNVLNSVSNDTCNYDNYYSKTIFLNAYPVVMDYPWYAVNNFPRVLGAASYPTFVTATNQSDTQLPQTVDGNFHPAF